MTIAFLKILLLLTYYFAVAFGASFLFINFVDLGPATGLASIYVCMIGFVLAGCVLEDVKSLMTKAKE